MIQSELRLSLTCLAVPHQDAAQSIYAEIEEEAPGQLQRAQHAVYPRSLTGPPADESISAKKVTAFLAMLPK